ncbi:MAG TPA: 50S ribosomal protein L4 [Pirellulales bacterium]|nr:50S ribosomal protein L4 [Pirellulales bacterium]
MAEKSKITVAVRDKTGQSVGTVNFDADELAPGINKQLLHDVVVMYEANRRVGTVQNRNRAQTEGSTKKLYRQKGTGRARAGTLRTGVRRGGGRAHARYPIDYSYRLPKKAIRLATRMALLSKFMDEQVTLLSDLSITEPKTKAIAGMLKSLGLSETSCLLATEAHDGKVWRSGRNIPKLWISSCDDLNAYDLLHQRQLILTRGALDRLRNQGAKKPAAAKG